MTKEELAALINGREYISEITREEEMAAKAAGLVVVFGASDDLGEFRGAASDEVGAYVGGNATVFSSGDVCLGVTPFSGGAAVLFQRSPTPTLTWRVTPDVPFAPFTINEDGEPFCEGAVFSLADCKPISMRDMLSALLKHRRKTGDYPDWFDAAARASLKETER